MKTRAAADGAVLVCAVALTRYLCRSQLLYDVDSVNFALALQRFDPHVHQPHPPGYYLYVRAARLLYAALGDANAALVALSILASCGTVLAIYALTHSWFGRGAALFSGLLFLVSPLCWFHGTVALTYIVEAFFSAALGWLCWQTYCGRTGFVVPSALALGLAAGFRQSSILFLGPLWLLSLRKTTLRQASFALAVLVTTVLAWFLPMIRESGGWDSYFSSLQTLWAAVPGRQTIKYSFFGASVARLCTILFIYVLCFGAAAGLAMLVRGERVDKEKKLFILCWLGPGLLFFTFVFLLFVNSGYLLVLAPPIFAWLGLRVDWWWRNGRSSQTARLAIVATGAMANVALFFLGPLYCSYRSVRRFEAELRSVRQDLRSFATPGAYLIVGFDSHFSGYRHAAYYEPDFLTLQFPEQHSPAGTRLVAVCRRNTQLLETLPAGAQQRFVLFPLPGDAEDREYVSRLVSSAPAGTFSVVSTTNHRFLTGRAADLALLFPSIPWQGVETSTAVHSTD